MHLEADALAIYTEPSALGQLAGVIERPAFTVERRRGGVGRMCCAMQSEGRLE